MILVIFDDIFGFLKIHGEILGHLFDTLDDLWIIFWGLDHLSETLDDLFYFGKFVLVTSKLLRRGPADFKMSKMSSKIFKSLIADFDDF